MEPRGSAMLHAGSSVGPNRRGAQSEAARVEASARASDYFFSVDFFSTDFPAQAQSTTTGPPQPRRTWC
jgi:hypothetical protein